jgi:hypothetical protein
MGYRALLLGAPQCHSPVLLFAAAVWLPSLAFGQSLLLSSTSTDSAKTAVESTPVAVVSSTQDTSSMPTWENSFDCCVDLREMDFSLRYRSVFDSNNAHQFNHGPAAQYCGRQI